MDFSLQQIDPLPTPLTEIPDPPKQLYVRGTYPSPKNKFLCIVGSRNYTPYGKQVCERLVTGLTGYPVVVVSGLALGIDGIAHSAALEAGVTTVAVPGSGLDDRVLYPAIHRRLAQEILDSGGALVSEFAPKWKPRPESFPQRNRIMAGMSHAVLVIEATQRSGTLITSRLATEYNRDVMTVPGPVYAETSKGPHMLLKKGAALIETIDDILEALGIDTNTSLEHNYSHLSEDEQHVVQLLSQPRTRDEVVIALGKPPSDTSILLSSLELKGVIGESLGKLTLR